MPAISRLFIEAELQQHAQVQITNSQTHYLINVMRKKIGDQVKIFNEHFGEWLAKICFIDKKSCTLEIIEQLRTPVTKNDLSLIFSPIKPNRLGILIEKATELGVTKFIPINTTNCIIKEVNIDKLRLIAIEAAEQCERLDIPEFVPIQTMQNLFSKWDGSLVMLCSEHEQSTSIKELLTSDNFHDIKSILIGPEGGFITLEIENLIKYSFIKSVHLGPRVLRAETAGIAAISCYSNFFSNNINYPRK
jgi:16S rRNA (uracil1498-N3)-methyltransferase